MTLNGITAVTWHYNALNVKANYVKMLAVCVWVFVHEFLSCILTYSIQILCLYLCIITNINR